MEQKAASKDKNFPEASELKTIFGNLDALIGINTTLLNQLDELMYLWDDQQKNQLVGPIFVKMVPFGGYLLIIRAPFCILITITARIIQTL